MEIILVILILIIIVLFIKENNKSLEDKYLRGKDQSDVSEAEQLLINSGYEVKKKTENSGCTKIIMGFAVILGVLLMIIFIGDGINKPSSPGKKTYSKTYSNDYASKLEAYSYAENWVKDKLKSPSSAKFPDSERKVNDTEYYGDNTYKIKSYVESQNSFGAMIKTNFSCTISFKDGSVYCNDLILY